MRRGFFFFSIALFFGASLFAADKDTAAAADTRSRKLKAKVTVDFKDELLSECIKEFSRQLEEANIGSLSASYDVGVSQNQRLTFAAKDATVEDVLDGMLKKNSLGYFVVSKATDRYDGWLRITRGNERGYPAGAEAKDGKSKDTKARDVKVAKGKESAEPKPMPPMASGDKTEKEASGKLELARSFLKDGKTDRAKQRFQEIVDKYPNTKAAEEAKKELEKIGS